MTFPFTGDIFPSTDFNKVNLDWICDTLQKDRADIDQNTTDIEELKNTVIDYDDLVDKPQINSVTLSGNKSLSDIGAASADELDDLKSALSGVEGTLPKSVYSVSSAANLATELGNCDNTGAFSTSTTRARTDYLLLEDYYSILVDSSLSGKRSYWVRLFDNSKTYIGSANGSSAVQTETTIRSIIDDFPAAVYGIAVVKCLDPNDGSLKTRPHGLNCKTYILDGAKTLDDLYARLDNVHQTTVKVELECGDFGQGKYSINALKNWRSKYPCKVVGGTRVSFDFSGFSSVSGRYIWKYGADFSYLGLVTISAGTTYADLPSNVAYIRFEIDFSTAQGLSGGTLEATLYTDRDDPFIKNFAVDTTRERFCYKLKGEEYYTNGMLKLPPNYSVDGKAVPLIVFVHGSADYYGLTSSAMTTNYESYYNFLRDNGYAIFDCYGWGNKFMSTGANTWATPTNTNCYVSGIEYVCDRFNIDKENIFVAAKSLGGIQAAYFLYSQQIKVKAVGLLAPEVNQLCQNLGYTVAERQACAADFGFSEDTNGVLDTDPFEASADYKQYIFDNVDKLEGWVPAWYGLQLPPSTRVTNAIDNRDGSSVDYTNVYKYGSVPVKIWFAMDDQNINPYACANFVKALTNAGCRAAARIMPNNTGKHHAVDTDENALQTTNITTPLGIEYETIPTAYYELAQWFNSCAMIAN